MGHKKGLPNKGYGDSCTKGMPNKIMKVCTQISLSDKGYGGDLTMGLPNKLTEDLHDGPARKGNRSICAVEPAEQIRGGGMCIQLAEKNVMGASAQNRPASYDANPEARTR